MPRRNLPPTSSSSRVLPFTRDDARYWESRPADHGTDGLYRDGPKQAVCGLWELVGKTMTPSRREIAAQQVEREAQELRRARRRAQPAPARVVSVVPHPRASRRLLQRVAPRGRGWRVA